MCNATFKLCLSAAISWKPTSTIRFSVFKRLSSSTFRCNKIWRVVLFSTKTFISVQVAQTWLRSWRSSKQKSTAECKNSHARRAMALCSRGPHSRTRLFLHWFAVVCDCVSSFVLHLLAWNLNNMQMTLIAHTTDYIAIIEQQDVQQSATKFQTVGTVDHAETICSDLQAWKLSHISRTFASRNHPCVENKNCPEHVLSTLQKAPAIMMMMMMMVMVMKVMINDNDNDNDAELSWTTWTHDPTESLCSQTWQKQTCLNSNTSDARVRHRLW